MFILCKIIPPVKLRNSNPAELQPEFKIHPWFKAPCTFRKCLHHKYTSACHDWSRAATAANTQLLLVLPPQISQQPPAPRAAGAAAPVAVLATGATAELINGVIANAL